MDTLKNLIPVLAALISAIALLFGYTYQKEKDKEAEIRKTRQEIYSHLIGNITKRNEMQGRMEFTPEWKKTKNQEERDELLKKDVEFSKNEGERTEVIALLCLNGTDDAVEAYANYARENVNPSGQGGNLGELVLGLRKSIYPETHTTTDEANLARWVSA